MKHAAAAPFEGPLAWAAPLRNQLQQSRLFADLMTDGGVRRVGVCASHAGAGASSVALNLAVMLHERSGQPVLLVEGDLRKPEFASRHGLNAAPGLAEFSRGEASAEQACRQLPGSGVSLLPARADGLALPLLLEAAARLPELSQSFHYVVVDLPPVLEFPDASLLGTGLDGVVLVVEAEETRWHVAREAVKRLEAGGVTLLGVVLNKQRHVIPDWLYRLL